MLQPIMHQLNRLNIILASGSPRREEMLRGIGLKFSVENSTFDENLIPSNFTTAAIYAGENARHKALQIAYHPEIKREHPPHIIIAADTVVAIEEEVIGKPKDKIDATRILKRLSGITHTVCTSVALFYRKSVKEDFDREFFFQETTVKMDKLSDAVIRAYVDTEEPMDKAGAYGIQGIGGTLISFIAGDYNNVVGFPLHKFCTEIMTLHKSDRLFAHCI